MSRTAYRPSHQFTALHILESLQNLYPGLDSTECMNRIVRVLKRVYPEPSSDKVSSRPVTSRIGDPSTSVAAGDTVNIAARELDVLRTLVRSNKPMTQHEVAEESGIGYSSVTPRFKRLVLNELIAKVGTVTRPGERGRTAYVDLPKGRAYLKSQMKKKA